MLQGDSKSCCMLIRDESGSTQEDCNRSLPLWVPGQYMITFSCTAIKGATEMADKKPAAKKEAAAPKSTKAKEGAKAAKPAKKK